MTSTEFGNDTLKCERHVNLNLTELDGFNSQKSPHLIIPLEQNLEWKHVLGTGLSTRYIYVYVRTCTYIIINFNYLMFNV